MTAGRNTGNSGPGGWKSVERDRRKQNLEKIAGATKEKAAQRVREREFDQRRENQVAYSVILQHCIVFLSLCKDGHE